MWKRGRKYGGSASGAAPPREASPQLFFWTLEGGDVLFAVADLLLVFEFRIKLGPDSATLARRTEQCDGAKPFR